MKITSILDIGKMLIAVLCVVLGVQLGLWAADNAALFGMVTDPSGAAVPGATVKARNRLTGLVEATTSSSAGLYRFPLLPIGTYEVTVTRSGFQSEVAPNVLLQVNQVVRLDFSLRLAKGKVLVQVTAQASLVNTADATISTVIGSQRVEDLPLNGRNLLQLITLAPGVLPSNENGNSHPFQPQNQEAVAASGTPSTEINYSMDGVDNAYNYNNTANPYPSPDFVQEFSFETNNFDPEFGNRGGGVVNVVTKSGTNQFHGALFEYVRNYALNATNFFTPGVPDGLKRNQYGGDVGGPVIIPHVYNGTDKTFFFFGYQATKVRQVPPTLTAVVPTVAERNGDWSDDVNSAGVTTPIINPLTGSQFPGNIIPSSQFDPAAVNLLKYLPPATYADGLLDYSQRTETNDGQFIGRLDEDFSDKDTAFFRVFVDQFNEPSLGVPSNVLSARWPPLNQASKNLVVGWTHTFSPRVVNQTTFALNRQVGGSTINTDAPTLIDLGVNITDVGGDKALILRDSDFSISLAGKVTLITENFEFRNTTSIVTGNHDIRFGVDIMRRHFDIPRATYLGDGVASFGNSYTGNYLTDLLLGYPSSFEQGVGYAEAERETDWGFWAADRYRITRRLTLDGGLRYQPFLPYYDAFGGDENTRFVPGEQSTVYPHLPVGAVAYGDPGVPYEVTNPSYNRFSPRLGLAWDPFGNGKTSVRAGYGIFYGSFLMEYNGQFSDQDPYAVTVTREFPGSFVDPWKGTVNPLASEITFPSRSNTVFTTPFEFSGTAPGFREPMFQQFNFTIQRQLFAPSVMATISYQGSHGTHLLSVYDPNLPIYIPGASTVQNEQQRRPYPDFADIYELSSGAFEDYSALVLSVQKRFARGVSVLAGYTWSKSIDQNDDNTILGGTSQTNEDPQDPGLDRGLSSFNTPQMFIASYLWHLPSLAGQRRLTRDVFGGWEDNGIITLHSGTPFSVDSGVDNSLTGVGLDRSNLVGNPHLPSGRSTESMLKEYFNVKAFTVNKLGTYGTSGRNILAGPGYTDFDASLSKDFLIGRGPEGARFKLEGDFFDVFNSPDFSNPNSNNSSPLFGTITSASNDRILQLSLRFDW